MTHSATKAGEVAETNWRTRALAAVAGGLIHLVSRTWRIRTVNREYVSELQRAKQPFILVSWHGQLLAHVAEHRLPTMVLVSEHRDGEIIARILRSFGFRTVRGSSSRGAARALLQMSGALKEGKDVAITPDGPRGPRHVAAPGALVLSQRTRAPLLLIASHASRAWRLRSWDQFEIPKPFARVTVAYAKPFVIEGADARSAAAQAADVGSRLEALTAHAEQEAFAVARKA